MLLAFQIDPPYFALAVVLVLALCFWAYYKLTRAASRDALREHRDERLKKAGRKVTVEFHVYDTKLSDMTESERIAHLDALGAEQAKRASTEREIYVKINALQEEANQLERSNALPPNAEIEALCQQIFALKETERLCKASNPKRGAELLYGEIPALEAKLQALRASLPDPVLKIRKEMIPALEKELQALRSQDWRNQAMQQDSANPFPDWFKLILDKAAKPVEGDVRYDHDNRCYSVDFHGEKQFVEQWIDGAHQAILKYCELDFGAAQWLLNHKVQINALMADQVEVMESLIDHLAGTPSKKSQEGSF